MDHSLLLQFVIHSPLVGYLVQCQISGFQLTPNLWFQMRVAFDHCFCRKLMLVTIFFYATFVLQLIFKLLVGSLEEDLWEDPGSWAHIPA